MNNSKAKGFLLPVASWGNRLFLFFLVVFHCTIVHAAPIAIVDEHTTRISLDNHVDILDNADHIITIDKILNTPLVNGFAPVNLSTQSPLKSFSTSFWLRFSISNTSNQPQLLWLTANQNAIRSLELFKVDNKNPAIYETAKDSPLKNDSLSPLLKEIAIPAQTSSTFLIDIDTATQHSLQITLIKPQEFLPEQISRARFYSFVRGVLAMLAVVNLFFALYRQSSLFLYHSCLLFACIGLQTAALGLPGIWFDSFGEWQTTTIATLLFLFSTSALMTIQEYIKTSGSHNKYFRDIIAAQYFNTFASLVFIFFVENYTPLMMVPFLLLLPLIIASLFYCHKTSDDNIALYLGSILLLCSIVFGFSLFISDNIFSVELLTDPLLVVLITLQTITTSVLFIIREHRLMNNEFHQKQITDAQNTKHRAQQELMQEVSHDMQTPLSGILGMADLLKSSSLSAEQHGKVDTIKNSGQMLLNKISDIYYRIQLEQNSETIRRSPFELILLMENCTGSFQLSAEINNIELILQIQPDVPSIVKGDEYRLRQIIIHLIENAIKNTSQGEVLVTLSKNATDVDSIEFSVSDTGCGISKDKISLLKKSLEKTDAHKQGINTVKQLLSQLKSTLFIHSIEGEGSNFSFSLDLPAVQATNAKNILLDGMLKNKRVLIVDDNHTSCKVIKQQASTWGMKVTEANTGNEALAMYRAKHNLGETFDAIILDYDMPQVSGIEVAEKISMEADIKPIIIMLAGLSQSPPEYIAKQAGIDLILNKPASQKLLQLTLCNLFEINKKSSTARDNANYRKMRLLVADDNDVIRSVIGKMMDSMGIDYKMVSDGKLALDAVKKERFDVILMDCEMPFMNGFEATREIYQWQREKNQHLTPIIALTAYTLGEHKNKSIAAGMCDYLEKPINMNQLEAVLKRYHVMANNN